MQMKRKIYEKLMSWKNSTDRKPLILQGPRQVGKTYIVNTFGQSEYANCVYCNFEQDEQLNSIFSFDLNPYNLIAKIQNYKRKEIIPNHTLIIFDEIQACPKAITSLKYFCEEANDYHIIASGSLLGVSVYREEYSFPVGKVQFMNMYPMDFEEFLLAYNEEYLVDIIKKSFVNNTPLDAALHNKALNLYKQYLYVGGMPEVVSEYIESKNIDLVRDKQLSILNAYFNDMGKYNKATEIPKTKLVFKSISIQLAKENKKFKYNELKTGGRAKEFEQSIEWVSAAGIASQLYRLEQVKLPFDANRSLSDFKFYMSDIGLCVASQNILFDDIMFDNALLNNFKGGLAENYVFNQLKNNGLDMYYWTSGNSAEVDFVTRINSDIIPIEVKSDDNVRSRSLAIYTKENKPNYSIRISSKNFGFENNVKAIPLYAAFCILSK